MHDSATQTVFGEGPSDARVVFAGEQPGDQEDLAGQPFVGPAGQIFDELLAQAGIDRRQSYVTNTVKHGHRGGSEAPVWIRLTASDGQVALTYEDRAPPFNPFARATREMLEALAETRREGGLGVLLAHSLTATADYAYLYGRNRIRLTLA